MIHNIIVLQSWAEEGPRRSFNPVISCENVPVNKARATNEIFRHGVDFIICPNKPQLLSGKTT